MHPTDEWRAEVLDAMLRIARWAVPVMGVSALALSSAPALGLTSAVVLTCSTGFVVVGAKRTLPYRARAWATLYLVLLPATYSVWTVGMAPNASAMAATCVVFAAIFLDLRAMLLSTLVLPLTLVVVGARVTTGTVLEQGADIDPSNFTNWARASVVFAVLAYLLGTAVRVVIRQVETGRERAAEAAEQLRIAYVQLGRLHQRLEATKEDERRHLSRELHDELGQSLTALKLRLQTVARTAPSSGNSSMDESIALVGDMLQRVRNLAVGLRPPLLDELGLEAALRALSEEQSRVAALPIAYDWSGSRQRLPPEVEMTCFRVVQEALTNVVRHAGAREARIRVACNETRIEVVVSDDGRGMSPHDVAMFGRVGHLGLVGMRERTRASKGQIRLLSPPPDRPNGTWVEISLPVAAIDTEPTQPGAAPVP